MGVLLFITVFAACMIPRFYLLPGTGIAFFHMRISVYCMLLILLLFFIIIKRGKLKKTALRDVLFFVFWLVVAVVQILKTKEFGSTIESIYYIFLGTLSIIVFNIVLTEEKLFNICFFAISCALVCHEALGIFEIATQKHLFTVGTNDSNYFDGTKISPVSIFLNNNDFGTFIIVNTAIVFGFLSNIKKRGPQVLSVLFIALGAWLVIYAQSDTTLLAVLLVVAGFFVVRLTKKKRLVLGILGVLVVGIIIALVIWTNINHTTNSITVAINNILVKEVCRVNLLRNGFSFLKATKGLGIGYGNAQYYLQYALKYYAYDVYYFHNWYLEILFCGGILLFVFYCLFHFQKAKQLFKLVSKEEGINHTLDGKIKMNHSRWFFVFASFLIFSVVCVSSSSNLYSEWVWMYLGIISAFSNNMLSDSQIALNQK